MGLLKRTKSKGVPGVDKDSVKYRASGGMDFIKPAKQPKNKKRKARDYLP